MLRDLWANSTLKKLSIPGGSYHPRAEDEGQYLWDVAARTEMGRYLLDAELGFITRSIVGLAKKPQIALDAGAGSGRITRPLSNLAVRVIATETEPALVKQLAGIESNVTPLLVSPESKRLPLQDATADVILSIQAADLAQTGWFHQECGRVLKPGGVLILTLQNRRSWKGLLATRRPERYRGEFGARYYERSLADITRHLEAAGLMFERALGYNWLPFTRVSDSPLIKPLAKLERWLLLRRLAAASPWVLLSARKPISRVTPAARSRSHDPSI